MLHSGAVPQHTRLKTALREGMQKTSRLLKFPGVTGKTAFLPFPGFLMTTEYQGGMKVRLYTSVIHIIGEEKGVKFPQI